MSNVQHVLWLEAFEEEEQLVQEKWNGSIPIVCTSDSFHETKPGPVSDPCILTTRTHSRLTNVDIPSSVRCIISRSTGYDHLPVCLEIPVGYLPDYATNTVAEHNVAVIFHVMRSLSRARRSMQRFDRSGITGRELRTRTVGIVGVGRIGKATAEKVLPLCHRVLGFDVEEDAEWARHTGVKYVRLPELFRQSEIVVLALPYSEETEGLITKDLLFSLPSGSILVNSGRGEVVRSTHLLEALESGPVDAMALDVFSPERELAETLSKYDICPESASEELRAAFTIAQHPRVLATPHNAFNTEEALVRKVDDTLENIRYFLTQGDVLHPVPEG